MRLENTSSFEASILGRVIKQEGRALSKSAARAMLTFHFPQSDLARMNELAAKNQEGKLSRVEQGELEAYLRIGRLLDLLSAKARLALRGRDLSA
jgi:hypothetical protein